MLKSKLLCAWLCRCGVPCGRISRPGRGLRKQWLRLFGLPQGLSQGSRRPGLGRQALSALDGVTYDPGIVKKDRAQNIFSQSFLEFQARMITDYRIKHGAELVQKHKATFARVEKEFGVPAPVIVAFWALETDFGANIGDLPTVQSLATLAWDCRRPEKFRPQLMAALQLIQNGDLHADEMRGAWAGEIGQTQFLPYDYNESAVDFDGDGRRDLRGSIPDVLASSANLLRKHGWQPGQPWMQEVRVPTRHAVGRSRYRHPASPLAMGQVGREDGQRKACKGR